MVYSKNYGNKRKKGENREGGRKESRNGGREGGRKKVKQREKGRLPPFRVMLTLELGIKQ